MKREDVYPLDYLTERQREALADAIVCAAREGKALSNAEVDDIARQLLRLNRPQCGIFYCL